MASSTDQKSKEAQTVVQHLGDMHALESHIFQAIDKQDKLIKDHPGAQQLFHGIKTTLETHLTALQARIDELGGTPGHPLKEGVAALAGIAAGLYDKTRTEQGADSLRDDYTALNQAVIAYVMLHTTALAFNDQVTAMIAKRNLTDNAKLVMEINNYMPTLVIEEFKQDGLAYDPTAEAASLQVVREVWHQPPHTPSV